MTDQGITDFFQKNNHYSPVKHEANRITSKWSFQSADFPVFIQTQKNVNRMRMAAFICKVSHMSHEELMRLMTADYCSAFLHSFSGLTDEQFLSGLFQVINCTETCGTTSSGGTIRFGHRSNTNRFQDRSPPFF